MILHDLDGVTFKLRKARDFKWLKRYGSAFWSIDETGSGCICIGMQNENQKYFCKIAGVETLEADVSPLESVNVLKHSVQLYQDLCHPNLTKVIEHYEYEDMYIVVFEWSDGECLFDHWNFDQYKTNSYLKSPAHRFNELPVKEKLDAVTVLFSFLTTVSNADYVAVDFYDGSIMYDFSTKKTTICDIDFFQKKPLTNTLGKHWFGTKRLKAPEEYVLNARIDDDTTVFTLGALIFNFFGEFSPSDIAVRYENNQFFPCSFDKWQLNEESYAVVLKATGLNRKHRFRNMTEFHAAWNKAIAL